MFPISYRDLELMLLDRGVEVDYTTLFRWIQANAAELEKRIRPHARPHHCRDPGGAGIIQALCPGKTHAEYAWHLAASAVVVPRSVRHRVGGGTLGGSDWLQWSPSETRSVAQHSFGVPLFIPS